MGIDHLDRHVQWDEVLLGEWIGHLRKGDRTIFIERPDTQAAQALTMTACS